MILDALEIAERARVTALKRDMQFEYQRAVEREELRQQNEESKTSTIATEKQDIGRKRPREAETASNRTGAATSSNLQHQNTTKSSTRQQDAIMSTALSIYEVKSNKAAGGPSSELERMEEARRGAMARHSPWRVKKVLLDHAGWVRCVAVDPSNEWFATGSVDTVIKVWDLSTGKLKQNFTGHKESVRGLVISSTSPYMFSASEDRSVKCWDLEMNRIIRDYHGHGGSVNTIAAHPDLDVIVTGSRDKSVKLWDVRSQRCIHTFQGHTDAVMSLAAQNTEPQIISGGSDTVVYLWDIRTGKPITNLTRHKKPVEALVCHKTEDTLVSIGSDNVRKWKLPLGVFYTNMVHETVRSASAEGPWCCAALSPWGELCVGGRDGTMRIYDWSTNILLQQTSTRSIQQDGEKGIFCCAFDASGKRLITGEVDKTVKIWEPKSTGTSAA